MSFGAEETERIHKEKARDKSKDWVPVRRGLDYCSPACGGRCTFEEYLLSKAKADALAREANHFVGGTWISELHENLGWHWQIRSECGRLRIITQAGGYKCYLGKPHEAPIEFMGEGRTIKAAIRRAIIAGEVAAKDALDLVNNLRIYL